MTQTETGTDQPPIVDYQMEAFLDVDGKRIIGSQTLRYTNLSPDIIGDLWFHFYPNAQRDNLSAGLYGFRSNRRPKDWWGYLHPQELRIAGRDRLADLSFVQTEDAPAGDRTVVRVPLESPLLPGETLTIEWAFETRLPRPLFRSGHDGRDFFFVAQWFPKLGVWETRGVRGRQQPGWNCHAHHPYTEFYADFGNYTVTIDTPAGYEVGATGLQQGPAEIVDDEQGQPIRQRHTFFQDRVHDFVFTASPRFVRVERTFRPEKWVSAQEVAQTAALHGIDMEAAALRPVTMILLIQPEHTGQIERHFRALSQAIKHFGLWFGPYPYPTLTMVDPAKGARMVGGMEYPTLISLGTHLWRPSSDIRLEGLIFHEFAHQYWYSMVASNEFEESWLDEGFTEYSEAKLLDLLYPRRPSFMSLGLIRYRTGFQWPFLDGEPLDRLRLPVTSLAGLTGLSQREATRLASLSEDGIDQILRPGWSFHYAGYGRNSYSKPATALWQLERELGERTMMRVLRTYADRWSFRHPATADFVAVVNDVSGRDMNWFFEELFYKPGRLDYSVDRVFQRMVDHAIGWKDGPDGPAWQTMDPDNTHPFQSVVLRNHGNIHYPVDVRFTFSDGHTEQRTWNGTHPWVSYEFAHPHNLTRVEIDPERKLIIDADRANNSWLAEPNPDPARGLFARLLVSAQHWLDLLGGGL